MKIDMPNEKEIEFEIDNIIERGLEKKQSFYSYLKNMYRQIGIRYLFHDGLEIGFITLVISSILFSVAISHRLNPMEDIERIYSYIFTVSPILYLAMSVFNIINTKQNKTYEIEMTCKYDIYQISAFRMLAFSVVSILINFLCVYILAYKYEDLSLLRAFIISIASLFLFSIVFLYSINSVRNKWMKYITILTWIGLNLSLYIFKIDFYINLLNNVSIYTWFLVITFSVYRYIKGLKKLVIFRNKEGVV